MAYQGGMGSGNGYGHGYDPPGAYPQQGFQQQFIPGAPRTSWDGSSQSIAMQQQMHQMQQVQHTQPQNQAAYYQQHQYVSMPNNVAPNGYYQVPVGATTQYPQYVQQYEQSYAPQQQFQSTLQQQYQIPQPVQQQAPQPRLTQFDGPASAIPVEQQDLPTQQIVAPNSNASVQILHKSHKHTIEKTQPADISMLLVYLAEEFFDAAHSMGPPLARNMEEEYVEEYQKAIATGLGCMEAALTQTQARLAPRIEAKIRLRYAGVLFEETENYMEAETCLAQGISLSEQNRYLDIKYCMQVMLAQLVYKKSPKAAIKSLERHGADAAAYRHYCWQYVFYLLKASLSMKSSKLSDIQAALHDLHQVSTLAQDREDHGVYLLSSLMEILIHLMAPTSESKEHVQRALAAAWTYQTTSNGSIPQLQMLTHILGLTCSLVYDLPPQAVSKQRAMEEAFRESGWSTFDDSISIPIQKTRAQGQIVSPDTHGLIGSSEDGRDTLVISWLNNNDAFALMYLLSGVALLHENSTDGKAVKYLREGLKAISGGKISRKATSALPEAMARSRWREIIISYLHVYIVLCHALNTNWKAAKEELYLFKKSLLDLGDLPDSSLSLLYTYLSGVCFQGSCDLDNALEMYRHSSLRLPEKLLQATAPEEQLRCDLSILAALNTLWILQEGIQYDPGQNGTMIAELEPLCAENPNRSIRAAFNLVRATVMTKPPTSTLNIKNYLGWALEGSKVTANKQFLAITMSVMRFKFFGGVVGEQAEKSGRVAVMLAKKAKNTLWGSVSNGMLAESLETQGKNDEARSVQAEALRLAAIAIPGSS